MAVIRAFRAVRPAPAAAPRVAAVPYDVVDTEEARQLAAGSELSFLHVSRAEIDLPAGTDPHSDVVYRTAAERYARLKREAPFVQENDPAIYLYRLAADGHEQTGVAACYSLADYDSNVIKKHERTRQDKEDDRTRHIIDLRAQTGPVFLTHRPHADITRLVNGARSAGKPLIDFTASDAVRHTIWRIEASDISAFEAAFRSLEALYIADGHHRAASAARAREALPTSIEARLFLAVAFPSDQVRILPYNRVVRDLNGMTAEKLMEQVSARFRVAPGMAMPETKGRVSMYVAGRWYSVDLNGGADTKSSVTGALDCSVLEDRMLRPILAIRDIRTDKRVDFIGGGRGTTVLEQMVDSGRAAVAFSMYPVSVDELMNVADAGAIMPPKSTWFEPKLRDGLLIHEI